MSTTKEKAIERLDALDAEAKKLREIINAPDRKPERGDVWQYSDGEDFLVCGNPRRSGLIAAHLPDGLQWDDPTKGNPLNTGPLDGGFTYLGKFEEVYVKVEDVRAALSIEDFCGDSVLRSNGDTIHSVYATAIARTLKRALAKLNIK